MSTGAIQECECPVRLAAKALVDEAGPIPCVVRRTHRDLVLALADPCPCGQLRGERAAQYQRAQSLQDSLLTEVCRADAAEAERDRLRTGLAEVQAYADLEESRIVTLCEVIGAEDLELAADKVSWLLAELSASRALLEAAREVLNEMRCVKLTDTRRRLAVLAKIEAAQRPASEVTK